MMVESDISFDFEYAENVEKIFKKNLQKKEKELLSSDELGTCFSSILNSKQQLIDFKNEIIHKYKDKYNSNIQLCDMFKIIDSIYEELSSTNKYFAITHNALKKEIALMLKTNRVDLLEHIYNIVINLIIKMIDDMIENIMEFEKYCNSELKPDVLDLHLSKISYAITASKKYNISQYSCNVDNFKELLMISFNLLFLEKYHIKICEYPNCNKIFVTKRNQTKFCNNACPIDSSQTCRSIRKRRPRIKEEDEEKDIEEWEEILLTYNAYAKNIAERFNYYIKREKNARNNQLLKTNKTKFKNIINDLKKLIVGAKNESKRKKYLKNYIDFINDTNQKTQLKNFKIRKIDLKKL